MVNSSHPSHNPRDQTHVVRLGGRWPHGPGHPARAGSFTAAAQPLFELCVVHATMAELRLYEGRSIYSLILCKKKKKVVLYHVYLKLYAITFIYSLRGFRNLLASVTSTSNS